MNWDTLLRFFLVGLVAAVCLALHPASARAQEGAPPAIIVEGLDALRATGADAAIDVWLKGWPPEAVAGWRGPLQGGFAQVGEVAGRVAGYDFVGSADWGPHTRRVYFTILGKDRPFYMRFDVYQAAGTWKVLNVTLNTDPAEVFPASFLVPRRP